jgi:hypothetical protein
MKTLSTDDLSLVTGGKTIADVAPNGSNDQIMSALTNIQSSLKDLGKSQNQGMFGGQNGLMFMTMALAMRQSNVVVYGGGCRRGCRRW